MTTYPIPRSSKGFTLVELVVTIVVSTIVVGFVTLFITTPIDGYMAQARRSELIVEADLIKRNMDHDIRGAVPNSIRISPPGPVTILEMLYATDVANYRKAGTGVATQELGVGAPDTRFNTLGRFNLTAHPFNQSNYYMVVNHTGAPGQNAYTLSNVITAPNTNINIPFNSGIPGEDRVTLSTATNFTADSPTHNIFLVSGPVAYVCDKNAHTLTRYAGYPITVGIAANRNAFTSMGVIAKDINTCNFRNSASTPNHSDLVSMDIQLQRSVVASTSESMTVFMQVPVENMR